MRLKLIAVTLLCWSALLAVPAVAQNVACGNGAYCPPGNACLQGGLCGRYIDVVPGSLKMSNGKYCGPGFHEHKYRPGNCVPPGNIDCPNGSTCPPPNAVCRSDGACDGGPPATGPICKAGNPPCFEGRVCSSGGTCMNPAIAQDCGNGLLCPKTDACGFPTGCAIVAPERTKQFR
jgi:hypothetical protein